MSMRQYLFVCLFASLSVCQTNTHMHRHTHTYTHTSDAGLHYCGRVGVQRHPTPIHNPCPPIAHIPVKASITSFFHFSTYASPTNNEGDGAYVFVAFDVIVVVFVFVVDNTL